MANSGCEESLSDKPSLAKSLLTSNPTCLPDLASQGSHQVIADVTAVMTDAMDVTSVAVTVDVLIKEQTTVAKQTWCDLNAPWIEIELC